LGSGFYSGIGSGVFDFRCRVSSFEFRVSGIWGYRNLGFGVLGFGFRVLGFGLWVLGFWGFGYLGFGFWVTSFGF